MYRYIFFDLDGTLTDSKEGVIKSARYAIEKMGWPQLSDATLLKFVGPPLVDSFMAQCGATRAQAEEAVECYRERYMPIGIYENAAAEGAVELLKHLREKGYRTAEDAGEILMVGDRKYDVLGAGECGISCVGLTLFGYAEEGELEGAGAAAMVSTMAELDDYILHH